MTIVDIRFFRKELFYVSNLAFGSEPISLSRCTEVFKKLPFSSPYPAVPGNEGFLQAEVALAIMKINRFIIESRKVIVVLV